MPIDIECCLEVKESDGWVGNNELSELNIFANGDSDIIFGISKLSSNISMAGNRGLPSDISVYTNQLLDSYRKFDKEEDNFSFDELNNFSYLNYSEVLTMNLHEHVDESSVWLKVFNIMKFKALKGYTKDNIRIIVWSHW